MGTFSLVVMIAAVIGVVVMILLFERKRAQQIEQDLRRTDEPSTPPREWEREE